MDDNTQRFSGVVDSYVKFRPTYPAEAVTYLCSRCGVGPGSAAADLGSGTGKFTQLLLARGLTVYAVEPNAAMRAAAEGALAGDVRFHSVDGSAEATMLPDACVDLITVAQAFHWFDRERCAPEFRRILRGGGKVALLWNRRDVVGSAFMDEYEKIVRRLHGGQPIVSYDKMTADVFAVFFRGYEDRHFHSAQRFDFEGLWGRAQSSSYAPKVGHENYEPQRVALRALFDRYQKDGEIDFLYDTQVVVGEM
jgi:SAM-dependent methyltransferase